MTEHLERPKLDTLAKVDTLARILPAIETAPPQPVEVDRSFGFPPALHIGLCGVFLTFLAVMGLGLATPGLIIPLAICLIFTTAMFAVPGLWATMKPDNPVQSPRWSEFKRRGVMTATGHCSAQAAMAQMYVVPLVVLGWGFAIVTIWGLTA
jgi:hypothetical protein